MLPPAATANVVVRLTSCSMCHKGTGRQAKKRSAVSGALTAAAQEAVQSREEGCNGGIVAAAAAASVPAQALIRGMHTWMVTAAAAAAITAAAAAATTPAAAAGAEAATGEAHGMLRPSWTGADMQSKATRTKTPSLATNCHPAVRCVNKSLTAAASIGF